MRVARVLLALAVAALACAALAVHADHPGDELVMANAELIDGSLEAHLLDMRLPVLAELESTSETTAETETEAEAEAEAEADAEAEAESESDQTPDPAPLQPSGEGCSSFLEQAPDDSSPVQPTGGEGCSSFVEAEAEAEAEADAELDAEAESDAEDDALLETSALELERELDEEFASMLEAAAHAEAHTEAEAEAELEGADKSKPRKVHVHVATRVRGGPNAQSLDRVEDQFNALHDRMMGKLNKLLDRIDRHPDTIEDKTAAYGFKA